MGNKPAAKVSPAKVLLMYHQMVADGMRHALHNYPAVLADLVKRDE